MCLFLVSPDISIKVWQRGYNASGNTALYNYSILSQSVQVYKQQTDIPHTGDNFTLECTDNSSDTNTIYHLRFVSFHSWIHFEHCRCLYNPAPSWAAEWSALGLMQLPSQSGAPDGFPGPRTIIHSNISLSWTISNIYNHFYIMFIWSPVEAHSTFIVCSERCTFMVQPCIA